MSENTNSGNQQGANGGQQKPSLSWSQPAVAKPAGQPAAQPSVAPTAATTSPANAASSKTAVEASNMGTYIGIFVAGVIIGALIGWGISGSRVGNNTPTTASTTATTSTTTGVENGVDLAGSTVGNGSAITLASSQPAGFAVVVTKAVVSQPMWLVVYEDRNGAPGNAIGAGLFFPGSPSGTIVLLRATMPGKSYFVGQSVDNGDKAFSLSTDKTVVSQDGKPLYTQFTAQ